MAALRAVKGLTIAPEAIGEMEERRVGVVVVKRKRKVVEQSSRSLEKLSSRAADALQLRRLASPGASTG